MLSANFLAPTAPEIWRGSHNSKSRSHDLFPNPLWPNFAFFFVSAPRVLYACQIWSF